MREQATGPGIDEVRQLAEKYSNWGRWGDGDELGTLNLITQQHVVQAADLVKAGRTFSLSIPFDDQGPQKGGFGRFNPIHLMIRDGADAVAGTTVRDFYGGNDRHIRGTDDIIIMPLQCATQWDALGHIVFENRIWNGYHASDVSSKGARRGDIAQARSRLIGRGVLLDVPRALGSEWLEPGHPISADELTATADKQGVAVGEGDIVLIRTGQMGQVKSRGDWGDYAGGPAPGLALSTPGWFHDRDVAAIATDTWGAEVLPNETKDVFQPLHIIMIVHMGLMVGEIFDLEELAADCAEDGVYEFMFSAAPLPITGAVGSPVNPIAVK